MRQDVNADPTADGQGVQCRLDAARISLNRCDHMYDHLARRTMQSGAGSCDAPLDDGVRWGFYRWPAGGAMRGLWVTRMRGVPLAGEALSFAEMDGTRQSS